MNTVLLVFLLIATATAQSFSNFARTTPYPLISRTEIRDDSGQFAYSYKVADGTDVNERGSFRGNPEGPVLVKQGSFSYISPEGITYQTEYVADENGFRPTGRHLPNNFAFVN